MWLGAVAGPVTGRPARPAAAVKHIGLTVVGTVAMAFAIWSGIVAFEFYTQIMRPALPLAGGDRIVGIVMVDTAGLGEKAPTLHDFVAWRDALKAVPDLAVYRDRNWNVIVGDAAPEPVPVAEMSAATFRVVLTPFRAAAGRGR
jgi:hypothetical protein